VDKKTALDVLSRFRSGLEKKGLKITRLVLYGSFAKGTFTESSDIDVVVISDGFVGKGYWERIDILSDVIYEIFAPIEAVAMTQTEWENHTSFVSDYAKDGEIVYAA
jgi:predicted nucleotidyltransferase